MPGGADTLAAKYREDSRTFLTEFANCVAVLERDPGSRDSVHGAFRAIHSLKSEAAYLGHRAMSQTCYEIENRLEQIRSAERMAVSGDISFLKRGIEAVTGLIGSRTTVEENGDGKPQAMEFDDFERRLFAESKERGEVPYRVRFSVDEDASMPYAKAYLSVNNLELEVNVIKVAPDLNDAERTEPRDVVVYCTATMSEQKIRKLLDIDQIVDVSVDGLDYDDILSIDPGAGEIDTPIRETDTRFVRIDRAVMDQLYGYVTDLDVLLDGMVESSGDTSGKIAAARRLLREMTQRISRTRKVRLSALFERFPRMVNDLCAERGKEADLSVNGGEIEVDRDLIDLVSDPLAHVLRNAVDHGIEHPSVRKAAGKSERGRITVGARIEGKDLVLSIADDGEGIDPQRVGRKAGKAVDGMDDLFAIISRPGFTLKPEADIVSGRGVGLDSVVQRIVKAAGGSVSLDTAAGIGTTLKLRIPSALSMMELTMVAVKGETVAIPSRHIDEIVTGQEIRSLEETPAGVTFRGYPLSDGRRIVRLIDSIAPGSVKVVISYLGDRMCLLADDVLYEWEIVESSLRKVSAVRDGYVRVRTVTGGEPFILLQLQDIMRNSAHPSGARAAR